MPEGPSLVILKEEVASFKGKKIIEVNGNSKENIKQLEGQKILDFKTWGKHFLIVLPKLTVRVHFLLFGTYFINYRKKTNPKLALEISNGSLNCYVCAVQFIEKPLNDVYDWEVDLLSKK